MARLLNYQDTILHLRQERGLLQWQGATISIHPYCTMAVQEACRTFTKAKVAMRCLRLFYGMLYPAFLWVDNHGKTCFFEVPAVALSFCICYVKPASSPWRTSPGPLSQDPGSTSSAEPFSSE
ncbi:hypothetical protein NDU88_003435 [Pleurodeles waltl]|uniref:Uncharacterized protein n=1 Tax=Pleurodeles waltl TaxID=8319 RepID=A0AAV7WTM2_PLEWA|nr:hypothetical protein NDU88_003435 [Pleurodeles waltl]